MLKNCKRTAIPVAKWKNLYDRACGLMADFDDTKKFNKYEIEALLMDIITLNDYIDTIKYTEESK